MHAHRLVPRPATTLPQRMAACAALLSLLGGDLTACSSQSQPSSPARSCARLSTSRYAALARVVFTGTILAGQTVDLGEHPVLISPARVRVTRYLKGSGPDVVSVVTGVTRSGNVAAVSEDGIEPVPGQHWKIYTRSQRMPYQTSMCEGSAPVSRAP